jgi:hypothetical protein
MNRPQEISLAEWEEIRALPYIGQIWGLTEDETTEWFSSLVYGVKFDFVSGSPGYVGPLYILQGDVLTGDPPIVLVEENGKLHVA